MLLHVKDQVRSVEIIPFGTTDTLIMAMIIVITVKEKTPKSIAFLRHGRCKFHTSVVGIEMTATSKIRIPDIHSGLRWPTYSDNP